MTRRGRGSRFRNAITIFAVLATLVGFSLAAAPLKTADMDAFGLGGETYYFFPDDAAESQVICKSGDPDKANLRKDQQRFQSFAGISCSGRASFSQIYRQNLKYGAANSKNAIDLKLRI